MQQSVGYADRTTQEMKPRLKPNWTFLLYLVVLGVTLTAIVMMASAAALFRVVGVRTNLESWLLGVTVLGLGVLPWPGMVALARSMVRPRRLDGFLVEDKPLGGIAVTLIALNDEQAVEQDVSNFAKAAGVESVILVDNGSSDRTSEIASRSGARVVRETQRGYGYACRRALYEGLQSGRQIVILCEADNTFRAFDVEKLVPYLRHADLVVGSRTHRVLLNGDSQLNSFFTLGNVFVAKLLQFRYWDWVTGGRVRLSDVGCTFLAIQADGLRRVLPFLEVEGNYFLPHMLIVALERGLRVIQVPVTFWRRTGVSKGGSASWIGGFVLGLKMIWHILTYRVRGEVVAREVAEQPTRLARDRQGHMSHAPEDRTFGPP